jgi:uncharacterized repeat protein (TIGR03803 family)
MCYDWITMHRIPYIILALSALPACHSLLAQGTGKMETIYSFEAPPGPAYPAAGPTISPSGVIYGTTFGGGIGTDCGYFNCGTVYELTRPASPGEAWTETTLHSFTNGGDGAWPTTDLVFGAGGTLYGWNDIGAFELTPPSSPSGPWTESIIYTFEGPPKDGGLPAGDLAIGKNGSLYGTTERGGTYDLGTVFQLTPPVSAGGAWTFGLMYSFRGDGDGTYPGAGVVVGDKGAIYGTTAQGGTLGFGTIFGLDLVSGVWEEKVLASLGSNGVGYPDGLVRGHNGALYGQSGFGAFKATPPAAPGGAWTVESLGGPGDSGSQSVAISASGAIYLTTPYGGTSTACGVSNGCGALYELLPPTSPGGTWPSVLLHSFTGQHGDGYQPNSRLVVAKTGAVYGTTYYGGGNFFGTVFRYTP